MIDFSAVRAATEWTWSHATSTNGSTPPATNMRLDAAGRLILYDPAHPDAPTLILDPAGKSSHVEPQGDLSMGGYRATPAP